MSGEVVCNGNEPVSAVQCCNLATYSGGQHPNTELGKDQDAYIATVANQCGCEHRDSSRFLDKRQGTETRLSVSDATASGLPGTFVYLYRYGVPSTNVSTRIQ